MDGSIRAARLTFNIVPAPGKTLSEPSFNCRIKTQTSSKKASAALTLQKPTSIPGKPAWFEDYDKSPKRKPIESCFSIDALGATQVRLPNLSAHGASRQVTRTTGRMYGIR
jgi:hypothetical protein